MAHKHFKIQSSSAYNCNEKQRRISRNQLSLERAVVSRRMGGWGGRHVWIHKYSLTQFEKNVDHLAQVRAPEVCRCRNRCVCHLISVAVREDGRCVSYKAARVEKKWSIYGVCAHDLLNMLLSFSFNIEHSEPMPRWRWTWVRRALSHVYNADLVRSLHSSCKIKMRADENQDN